MSNKNRKFNKDFKIVFQPYDKSKYGNNRRFGVGAGRLDVYIGKHNAETCFVKADKITNDKIRFKFRKMGIVDFYLK